MPAFVYQAIDHLGQETRGTVDASDAREAAQTLRNDSIYVVSIKLATQASASAFADPSVGKILQALSPGQYMPVGKGDLIFLFRQISLMLRAGHTIVEALQANQEMVGKRKLRRALAAMVEFIENGGSLSGSVAEHKKVFPPLASKLLEAGERSGELDMILDRLADDMERNLDIKRQLVTAFTYPSIVFLMAVTVSVALVGWVIPRFARFLTSRSVDLPPITRFLLDISAWFQDWGSTVGLVSLLVVFGSLVAYTTKPGKRWIDGMLLNMPIVGQVILSSSLAQATWTMAMQLRSGITLLDSLRIVEAIIGNQVIATAFGKAAEGILSGQPVSAALKQRGIPRLVRHMSAIGEQSGEMDGVMEALGKYYRRDLQARVKMLAAWVEPALILIVGGMVATVYLAFFQAALKVSTGGM
ncbi:MAG TPA: type II secretion system F family protein [Chromatiaceae bacterium]|nr:type II secretion system F family protein [Chromatiaceae bacterium]